MLVTSKEGDYMKKITKLFILLVLAFIVFVGVGCGKDNSSIRENPTLEDGSAEFYKVTEDSYTYAVTKQEMYAALKHNRGASSLITMVDTYLLGQEKNADGKTYLELATEEKVKEFIDNEVYGENKDELTDEEKAEAEAKFIESYRNNFDYFGDSIYGDAILNRYKVTVAQKLYAKDALQKEYNEKMAKYEDENDTEVTSPYFTDTQYANLYNSKEENLSTFNAIVVPFTTQKAALAAKASVGELNSKEAYINLYKTVYGYKYTDESVFALKEEDINATVLAKLNALEDGTGTADPFEVNDGQLFVFVYRINGDEKTKFDDLDDNAKDAIKAKDSAYTQELLDNALTTTYISTKIVELRASKNLAIYDDVLEFAYSSAISNYGEYKENTEKKDYVASVDGKEFSTKDLFDQMVADAKYTVLQQIITNKRLVANPKYNSFLVNGALTEEKATDLENKLTEEKKNFEDGTYTTYGYDPTLVTWKTFLEGTYGISSDAEYKDYVLASDVIAAYKKTVNPLEQYVESTDENGNKVYTFNADDTHAYWNRINTAMAEASAKYFNITGVHVLISLYDDVFSYANSGTQIDPTVEGNWSLEQITGARNLANEVVDYLKTEKGTNTKKLDKLMQAYKSAPTIEGTALSTLAYGENKSINLSAYKKLGLTLIWQNLGTFSNGSMVEQFNDSCKAVYDYVYDKDNSPIKELNEGTIVGYGDDGFTIYSMKGDEIFVQAIPTKFGYHVFVKTAATKRTNLESEESGLVRYIPTLEEIQKNVSGQTVSSSVKTAISTYYSSYSSELSGDYFYQVLLNNELKNLVSDENFKTYIDNYNENIFNNCFKKLTKDFLN